jgi:hypothetical protein
MPISQTLSIETKNGEAVILSFSAERLKQENNVLTLLDKKGTPAVVITIQPLTTHRIIALS